MRVLAACLTAGASIVMLAVACVGSDPETTSSSSSGASTSSTSTSSGAAGSSGASTSSGGSSGGSSGASSGGSSGGSSGTGDAGGPSIACDGGMCSGGDICCIVKGESNVESMACKPLAQCTTSPNECDGTEDCTNGEVCCVKTNGNSTQWTPSYCAKSCDNTEAIYQLCHQGSECADGGSCVAAPSATTPTGLKRCQ